MQNAERDFRLHQQQLGRQMSVPPFRHAPAPAAVGFLCGGLTIPLPGGHGARLRFLAGAH